MVSGESPSESLERAFVPPASYVLIPIDEEARRAALAGGTLRSECENLAAEGKREESEKKLNQAIEQFDIAVDI